MGYEVRGMGKTDTVWGTRYGVWGKPIRYGVRGTGKTVTVWGMRYGVWGKQLFKTGFFSVLNKFSKLC